MAEKTTGKTRKSTQRKKETEQKTQKASTVTPIDQAGLGQNQGRITQGPPISGQSEGSNPDAPGKAAAQSTRSDISSRSGAHPTADQSGASTPTRANPARAGEPGAGEAPNPIAKQRGSSPSVLNPAGSVQEGRHAAGVRPGGQELQERIRARAYELFEQRGRGEGHHQEDWAQAEAEVLREFEREKSA